MSAAADQQQFTIRRQFQLNIINLAAVATIKLLSLTGFSCRQTEQKIPPQRQAVTL